MMLKLVDGGIATNLSFFFSKTGSKPYNPNLVRDLGPDRMRVYKKLISNDYDQLESYNHVSEADKKKLKEMLQAQRIEENFEAIQRLELSDDLLTRQGKGKELYGPRADYRESLELPQEFEKELAENLSGKDYRRALQAFFKYKIPKTPAHHWDWVPPHRNPENIFPEGSRHWCDDDYMYDECIWINVSEERYWYHDKHGFNDQIYEYGDKEAAGHLLTYMYPDLRKLDSDPELSAKNYHEVYLSQKQHDVKDWEEPDEDEEFDEEDEEEEFEEEFTTKREEIGILKDLAELGYDANTQGEPKWNPGSNAEESNKEFEQQGASIEEFEKFIEEQTEKENDDGKYKEGCEEEGERELESRRIGDYAQERGIYEYERPPPPSLDFDDAREIARTIVINLQEMEIMCVESKLTGWDVGRGEERAAMNDKDDVVFCEVYKLNRLWTYIFKSVKWPDNYVNPHLRNKLIFNDCPLTNRVGQDYPITFTNANRSFDEGNIYEPKPKDFYKNVPNFRPLTFKD